MMAETQSNENLMGALTYLLVFITGIVFLVIEKKSQFIRFHAMQSTIFFAGAFVVNTGVGFVPFLNLLAVPLLGMAEFVIWIVLMWKAFNGEKYKLPYVGELAEKQLAKMG